MSIIFSTASAFARFFGSELGPAGLAEVRYLRESVAKGRRVLDVGGGEGKLANELCTNGQSIIVLDREQTSLDGADSSIYEGSLRRLLRKRKSSGIVPLMADAASFPLADCTCDAIVSSQLLEHLDPAAKQCFFQEAYRCLRPGGVLAISTPDGEFISGYPFSVSRLARRVIPPESVPRLPRSLRGPWLVNSVEEWEWQVGHYDRGCRISELAGLAEEAGLVESDRRATSTRLTCFWLDLTCTLPLAGMLAAPLVRLLYELEYLLPARSGANLMMRFRKPGASR